MAAQRRGKPALVIRMASAFKGEVRADELEAYRRAGGLVYAQLEQAESLRAQLAEDGVNLWYGPRAAAGQLLCTWSAFVSRLEEQPECRQSPQPSIKEVEQRLLPLGDPPATMSGSARLTLSTPAHAARSS